MVLSSMQLQKVSVTCDSAGFNALYYVLFCLFLSTWVLQSVCVHAMDFVSAHKHKQIQINKQNCSRVERGWKARKKTTDFLQTHC